MLAIVVSRFVCDALRLVSCVFWSSGVASVNGGVAAVWARWSVGVVCDSFLGVSSWCGGGWLHTGGLGHKEYRYVSCSLWFACACSRMRVATVRVSF